MTRLFGWLFTKPWPWHHYAVTLRIARLHTTMTTTGTVWMPNLHMAVKAANTMFDTAVTSGWDVSRTVTVEVRHRDTPHRLDYFLERVVHADYA